MKPFAAIDFGTSNSAICVGLGAQRALVPLEHGRDTMPTAVFFNAEEHRIVFGRHAIDEYQTGYSGRLMRSLKSLLGSELIGETTLINGRAVAYREIIGHFLAHLKAVAELHAGTRLEQLVLGRPVFFVDDNPERDRLAQVTLAQVAHDVGFEEVHFQYEPIAAALDYESVLDREALVLVADIGGGTSDFSLVRLGPKRVRKADRSDDVLASGGLHIAGTDFDQQLSLAAVMPSLGLNSQSKDGKPVPSFIYHEMATWHRINFLYSLKALAEAATLRPFYKNPRFHERLMKVLRNREGHRIAGLVEEAKVAVSAGGRTKIDMAFIEAGLTTTLNDMTIAFALEGAVGKIVETALQTVRDAGVAHDEIDALYFTGGSTGTRLLRDAIGAAFPDSRQVMGDPFASVARGLGVYASRLFR